MKRMLGVSLATVVLLAIAASTANACYCGIARWRCCNEACCTTSRAAQSSAARS